MNILFSVPRIHTNYTAMIKGLISNGHKVSFITMNSEKLNNPYNLEVNTHYFAPRSRPYFPSGHTKLFHFESFRALKSVIEMEAPDLIIVRDLMMLNIQIGLIAKFLKIPVLFYDQADPVVHESLKRRVWYAIVRLFISKYRMTTAKRITSDTDIPGNIFFIPFSVPYTKIKQTYKTHIDSSNPLKIIVVSKLGQKRKNLLFLLEALLPLFKQDKIRLSLYGMLRSTQTSKQNFTRLQNYIKTHNLISKIDLHPNEKYETVLNAYADHDLFVLPSFNELASISPFEAMSSGLPVIVTNQNGTNYIIEENVNGFIFDPDDKSELFLKINYFIDSPDKLCQFGLAALNTINDHYRPKHFSKNLEKIIYQNL
ncbi:glycosyltransferase [Rhodohalobacter sp. SW132]|uniref:glycosyltransferase family 4 protein n=1 Tax=Rhodohalobacter sp. SW132 TaxID=2293433 RepID=UPI000E25645C|nr:glycosyltransferase family 4 protein [Rhodohalobacter sp. SW132]REL23934.1 glycosyltransferase [Rhodohalobacter sp. SW132]